MKKAMILVVMLMFVGCATQGVMQTPTPSMVRLLPIKVTLSCNLDKAYEMEQYTHASHCKEGAEVEIYLIPFNGNMRASEVLAALDKQGFRPATFPELLALDGQDPYLYQVYSVVAPGSVREEMDGDILVPAISEYNEKKMIASTWLTYRFNTDRWRCAAVRK